MPGALSCWIWQGTSGPAFAVVKRDDGRPGGDSRPAWIGSPHPPCKKALAQFTNLFALVLLGASVITFASYLIQSPRDTGSLELAVAILAVVVLNGAIGFFQEYSAEKTSEALRALVPHTARVRRDGTP